MYSSSELHIPEDLFNSEIDPRLPYATRVNSREAYPNVICPLDLTVIAIPNDHGIRRQLRDLGVTTIDPPALLCNRVHQGRVYANLSWVMWMADIMPGADASDFEQQLFGQHIPFRITRPDITPEERKTAARHKWRFYGWMVRTCLGARRAVIRQLDRRQSMDLAAKTNLELDALIVPWQDQLITAGEGNTRGTLAGLVMIGALNRILGAEKSRHLVAILSDMGEVESAAPAQRIREIAATARRRNPGLAKALKGSYHRWETLREIDHDAYDGLRAVVDRYGYRSVAEFLISSPSWAEDPTPVMDSFIGLLASEQPKTDGKGQQREAALREVLKGAGPVRRLYLKALIACAHLGARTRERSKAGLIIRVDMLRQLFREIGRRFLKEAFIDDITDLYYLTLAEVRAVLTGNRSLDLRALINERRAEAERLQALGEPEELINGHEPVNLTPEDTDSIRVLNGQGVSGHTVEGIARVVIHTDQLDLFEPGEILVSSHTDAGWTPYFNLAAGVIVETGGLLTHTSVVARELGLPAVVNVRDATRIIRTGDHLILEPDTGEVRILSRAEGQAPQADDQPLPAEP